MEFPVIPGIIAGFLLLLTLIVWVIFKAFSRSILLGLFFIALLAACVAFPPLFLIVLILFAVVVTIAFFVSLIMSI